jgi:hypothetical protein
MKKDYINFQQEEMINIWREIDMFNLI